MAGNKLMIGPEIRQRVTASFDFPVIFTRNVFDCANPVLANAVTRLHEPQNHRAVVFVDDNVEALVPGAKAGQIENYFRGQPGRICLAAPVEIVNGGERIKNDFAFIEKTANLLLQHRLDRHSLVIAAGGGAVLDAVGFAASLVHRGLRLIRIPTTVLSQSDGGVGVKNGVNFANIKNALGTFAPPFAVINDFSFLPWLPDAQWRDGIAEAFKVAIIRDKRFFDFLIGNTSGLRERNQACMEQLVMRCAELHLEHIRLSGDPFESGRSRPLDFGHWAAHKLEMMSGHRISHGSAVAFGILLDSTYAYHCGWLDESELSAIRAGLLQTGFVPWIDEADVRLGDGTRELMQGLSEFREHLGGELCITFPAGIGARKEVHELDPMIMEKALESLKSQSEPT